MSRGAATQPPQPPPPPRRPARWRIRTCTFDAKGSVFGDPGIIYFSGERSEPVFCGAAGEKNAKFKARMVNFMSKWDTRVVHG